MVVNGTVLLFHAPIKDMAESKIKEHGVSYGLGEAGYDIRIAQEVWFSPKQGIVVIDGAAYDGRFALASAIEEFDMPTSLVGIVHDKSTWARKGLSVFNTVIENGWKGFLTLELVYHGTEDLIIPAGAGIAQVIFHKTSMDACYSGKYANQPNRPVSAINS